MSHVRMNRDPWGRVWLDDCPPPPRVVGTTSAPPLARGRLIVELPPCKPQGGVNTDWSGNKCSTLPASSYQSVLPTPETRLEAPKTEQAAPQVQPTPQVEQPAPQVKPDDVGTAGQARSDGGNHASWVSTIGFDVSVALILVLAFVVVRNLLLDPFGGEEGVERDDG